MLPVDPFAFVGFRQNRPFPALVGEGKIHRVINPGAFSIFIRQQNIHRVHQRFVLAGRRHRQQMHHAKQGGPMATIEAPQQREIVVAAEGADGIAILLQ